MMTMKASSIQSMGMVLLLLCAYLGSAEEEEQVKPQKVACYNSKSKCYMKYVSCPLECPRVQPTDPYAKACFLDCLSPKCEPVCRSRKANCEGPGAACLDPRFIGGDGIVFYFHGKSNQHFTLISDPNLQINAHFIGHRPLGRTRDYTWIQALGLMFGSHNFSVGATKAEIWDSQIDHLQFTYDGETLTIPEGHSSEWTSKFNDLKVERSSNKNSVTVTVPDVVEMFVTVVPITQEDNKVHNYQIPSDDSFAHLEVQFRFIDLSPQVDGVLGRTYRPDFVNPAKPGVAMPVVGGEDKYRCTSLLSADCNSCVFSPENGIVVRTERSLAMEYATLDCATESAGGNGIVCKK